MFYTRAEVLQKLQITPPTLYAFIKEGLLTKYRMAKGRVFFDVAQVDSLAKDRSEIKAVA
jgi:predicted site-specific integrase-resolvase